MLRFRRIRAERQEVLVGEQIPLLTACGNSAFLAAGSGRLARSEDDGASWESAPFAVPSSGGLRAIGCDTDLLAAFQDGTTLSILRRQDDDLQLLATFDMPATAGAAGQPGRFLVNPDDGLQLYLDNLVFQSTDSGRSWSLRAELPPGWSCLRPCLRADGSLIGAVLIEDASEGLRNTFIVRSNDGGKTWCDPVCVTRKGEIPGDLLELPDGRLVLIYGQETNPWGARAILSAAGGETWEEPIYVLAVSRWNGPLRKPRPCRCEPASGTAALVLADGTILAAFARGETDRDTDEIGNQPAVGVVRWTPDGMDKPPLCYPKLWTCKTDKRGYLDNGLVRMRPDDRFEGGDYIEPYEMMVCRRLAAEQFNFPDMGSKGAVVCRHPDGSLVCASRIPTIYRSTDEGRSWAETARIDRAGEKPVTCGFGVTSEGTYLVTHSDYTTELGYIARSDDRGETWTQIPVHPDPMEFMGRGDGSRIIELTDGTILMPVSNAWLGEMETSYSGDVIMRSTDDGRTWGDATVLPPGCCESNLIELTDGTLVCATRLQRDMVIHDLFQVRSAERHVPSNEPKMFGEPAGTWEPPSRNEIGFGRYKNEAIMISHDRGYNWTIPTLVTRMHEVSGDLALLPDGRLVMTYDQKDGVAGSRALVSNDGGTTWEEEIYVLFWGCSGRTSSITLKDGRVLTLLAGTGTGTRATIWLPE